MSRQSTDSHRSEGRSGFTLVELLIVTMIVAILATVAVPTVHSALLKADAARLVGEAHNVSLVSYDYLIETGAFPLTASAGTVPPELASEIAANTFTFKGMTYQWLSVAYPDRNNAWNARNLGVLLVDYSTRPEMADVMLKYAGGDGYWSPTHFYFVYRG